MKNIQETLKQSLLVTIVVFIVVTVLINVSIPEPSFEKLADKAAFEMKANRPELADKTWADIIKKDNKNISNHHDYIINHFDIPKKTIVGEDKVEYRDDVTIGNYYDTLSHSQDSVLADNGYYGRGLFLSSTGEDNLALAHFKKVKNKKLIYLNNSMGCVYESLGASERAEWYYRKEIEINGNLDAAYNNLIRILYKNSENEELTKILENAETNKYFPNGIKQLFYFKTGQPLNYFLTLFERVFSGLTIWGFMAAFLIMVSWVIYLRKIDIFDVEKWKNIILVLIMGMVLTFLVDPLSDFNRQVLGFTLNGNLLNDFLYCVFGIGAIEELAKIIPLLLVLRFTKIINEPFDYIVYASLSALGFAFIENLLYFSNHNLQIIHGRALTAVVSHMFDSSIIAYGLILNKYKRQKNPVLNFLMFYGLASLAHGFYDFWLINETAKMFSIFTILFLILSMFMWNSFKNNALNQSAFFDKDILVNNDRLRDYLLYSLAGILLFEYIALAIHFSPAIANKQLVLSVYSGTYLIFFLSGSLSKMVLNKGEWAPIQYLETTGRDKDFYYNKIMNATLKLERFSKNDFAYELLPTNGTVIRRLKISKDPEWYLVKLNTQKVFHSYLTENILIRTKDKEKPLLKGRKKQIIALYLIPKEFDLEQAELNRTDFKFIGWGKAE